MKAKITEFKSEGPRPLLPNLAKAAPYPVEALGPLRAVAEAVADITQAPVTIAAQSALAVASLAVQPFADVETLGNLAPASLNFLTIAESGERKSTVDRLLMKGVVAFECEAKEKHRLAEADWHNARDAWEQDRKQRQAEVATKSKEKSAAAQADLHALGPEPRKPLSYFLTSMEPTYEGLVKLYEVSRPALGCFADEGGGFLGGPGMNPENRLKTMASFSKLWDGAPFDRTRAGDGAKKYFGRRLAAHLMVQPIVARPLLADPLANGQGFLARFLVAEPTSHIGTRLRRGHAPESDAVVADFADRLRAHLDAPMPTGADPQELTPRHLGLSQEAQDHLWAFYERAERGQVLDGPYEAIRPIASKSAEQAARIAAVLTLWADRDATEVTAETMADAVTLASFYLTEAMRLVENGAVETGMAKAERIRQWIVANCSSGYVMPREIENRGPSALRSAKVVKAAIQVLVEYGWLSPVEAGTVIGGRIPREAYRILRT